MTTAEALARAAELEITLTVDGENLKARPAPLPADLRSALLENKPRVLAALRLRELHQGMGLSDAEIAFVEAALLSGIVSEIRLIVPTPQGGARPA